MLPPPPGTLTNPLEAEESPGQGRGQSCRSHPRQGLVSPQRSSDKALAPAPGPLHWLFLFLNAPPIEV